MSESTPETPETPEQETPATPDVNVEGDAVVNQAPDGGGIDQAPDSAGTSADGEAGSD